MSAVRWVAWFVMPALAGCASMSGLDAQSDFACKAPKGVSCASITAVHANANAGTLPAQQRSAKQEDKSAEEGGATQTASAPRAVAVTYATPAPLPTAPGAAPGGVGVVSPAAMNAPSSGTPLRTAERILRVWVAPFEDSDGDFHDQRYMYVTVNRGQWTVERVRAAIRNQYQMVRPLSKEKESAEPVAAKPHAAPVPSLPAASQ